MVPVRVQRQRARGWRMPSGVVYAGRPTAWGNPFKPGQPGIPDAQAAVAAYAEWLAGQPALRERMQRELVGKSLACWCRLSHPCHVDVVLAVANGRARPAKTAGGSEVAWHSP